MSAPFRWMVCLLLAVSLMAACTRERPTPEPTAAVDGASVTDTDADTPATATLPAVEPEVSSSNENEESGDGAADLLPTETPTPDEPQETFQYTVQPNDTLSSIAEKFETDMETLRELNRLGSDDLLVVGLPLNVPYVEGMTAEGMPTPTPGPFSYVVQDGDTLSGIAAQFNVDQIQIIESNNLLDPNNLTVGATIIIPGYQPPAGDGTDAVVAEEGTGPSVSASGEYVHIVQPGEGLIEIAQTYGITIDQIAAANGLVNPNVLRVGQELIIPGITAEEAIAARSITHVVQSGESLLGIALQYGVTVEEVMAANNLANPDSLDVGQSLIIPGEQ